MKKITSLIDQHVKNMRKTDERMAIPEKSMRKYCSNQINAQGITDEIIIIVKTVQKARKGLERKI